MEENENGAVGEFLKGIEQTDDSLLDFLKPEEPQVVVEEEKVEDKPLPFHKDPKIQRFLEKEKEKIFKEVQAKLEQTPRTESPRQEAEENPVVESFRAIIGDDTPEKVRALKELERSLSTMENKAAEKAAARYQSEVLAAQQAERENIAFLQNGIDTIEETFTVDLSSNSPIAKRTRNEFIDFVKRISPKNSDGEIVQYPDLIETFDVFNQTRKPAQNNEAKALASRGVQRTVEASKAPTERVTFDNVSSLLGLN